MSASGRRRSIREEECETESRQAAIRIAIGSRANNPGAESKFSHFGNQFVCLGPSDPRASHQHDVDIIFGLGQGVAPCDSQDSPGSVALNCASNPPARDRGHDT